MNIKDQSLGSTKVKKNEENGPFPLNPQQKMAAEAPISPLLIVAGAGTGKTKTLISRIVYLIESGIRPDRICAITFTNKAAQEMQERVSAAFSEPRFLEKRGFGYRVSEKNKPYIGTFHSLGASILRRECRFFEREPNFAIFDDHDSFDLIKKAVKSVLPKQPPDSTTTKKKQKEAPALFARKISELKNLDPERALAKLNAQEKEQIQSIFGIYESLLRRNNAFDFDDLIQKPVAMFKASPKILKKYQDKFDAILVDEYQDINPKQYELIRLLAEAHRNLTVVGDDEQTIYTWRHADIKIFLGFDKDWPGANVHFLEENYRSTGNIIRGASSVVQNNSFRTPKKLWTKHEDGEQIVIYEAWGENDEAAWIAMQIANGKSQMANTTVAILYRTNAQSRAIEQALIRENIPYKIYGGLKFYERREVKDVVAALRYASNGKDEVSKERLEKNLSKRKFMDFKDAVAKLHDAKPTDIIKIFMDVFGYFDYLEGNFINADERQENIAELVNFASGFEKLPDFLERLSLVQSTDDAAATNGKSPFDKAQDKQIANGQPISPYPLPVHLSTIHLAKGLEFDTVFIAGVAEGLLPHVRSIDNDASLEEERRLMYVAMTRAKKNLYISFYGLASRFIGEIPEEHVQLDSDSGRAEKSDRIYDEKFVEDDKYYDF